MTNKSVRNGILIIAAVLLCGTAFAGVAGAETVYIGSVEEWNAFAGDSGNYTKDIVLTGDLDFSVIGGAIQPLNKNKVSFSGSIDGYSGGVCHTISNFSIDGGSDSIVGLIGIYTGTNIKNLTVRYFSVSGGSGVGGLVGLANSASTFEKCNVLNCSVSGSYNVGGLVGTATSAASLIVDECSVSNCGLSGNNCVGGLVGLTIPECLKVEMKNCCVENCVVKSSTGACGGYIGRCGLESGKARSVDTCTVSNCVIYSTGNSASGCGGVIGANTGSGTTPSVSNCTVEFCTVAANGVSSSGNAGGITSNFPTTGVLDRNKVISCCIVSKTGKAAGICPAAL